MSVTTHALIIGGGPAGSSAAVHLARQGVRVTLVEARRFPRVKVCGEFVSPAATAFLEDLLPPDHLRDIGARRVRRFVLEVNRRERALELRQPAWALSRGSLDQALLEVARDAGASVIEGASVRSVEYTDEFVRTALADCREIESDIVVHANGSGSHDLRGPIPTDRRLVGLKCHLVNGSAIEGVRIRSCKGGYVGTIGVERGLGTCALVIRKSIVRACGGDLDEAVRHLWPGFDPSIRSGAWKASGVARSGYVRPGHARSLRIGNAAGAVDPIGGEGIGLALWAGRTLGDLLASGESLASVQGSIARAYRSRLRVRRFACRAAAEVLMHPALVRTGMAFVPMGLWYRATGKNEHSATQTQFRPDA